MSPGERIRHIRSLLSLTQEEMAFYMNVSQGSYSGYEGGREIPKKHFASLKRLGVEIDWLTKEEGLPINQDQFDQFKQAKMQSEVRVIGDCNALPWIKVPFIAANKRDLFLSSPGTIKSYCDVLNYGNIDYTSTIVSEVGTDHMEPTLISGEWVLCQEINGRNWNYISGVVFVAFGDFALIKRIKNNSPECNNIILYSDAPSGGTITIKKKDIKKVYKVLHSVYRTIS